MHAKCVTWPDDQLELLRAGSRPFCCNLCNSTSSGAKPSDQMEASPKEACSPQPSAPPTGSSPSPPGDLRGEIADLRRLLLDALEGIFF